MCVDFLVWRFDEAKHTSIEYYRQSDKYIMLQWFKNQSIHNRMIKIIWDGHFSKY